MYRQQSVDAAAHERARLRAPRQSRYGACVRRKGRVHKELLNCGSVGSSGGRKPCGLSVVQSDGAAGRAAGEEQAGPVESERAAGSAAARRQLQSAHARQLAQIPQACSALCCKERVGKRPKVE